MDIPVATKVVRDLVNRLAAHDIRYLIAAGGSDNSIPARAAAPIAPLVLDLARTPDARLQAALIAFLLRHPEHAAEAESVGRDLPTDDPARRLISVSLVAASALQSNWSFALGLYLGRQPRIEADHIARELGLPLPSIDFGRPALHAAADLLRNGAPFPFNYEADWDNAIYRLLDQLAREERARGA
jgi:hypothetical protein